ncbi:hypothetical protein ACFLXJ_03090 [Chloroflexota bacterium]
MATKRRNLFLYLTLVCFLSLIAIFIVDGYMGIYDTIYITSGEREQEIDPDVWLRNDRFWSTGVEREEKAFFRYEVDNRQFSSYTSEVEVSVWRMQDKVMDVVSQPVSIDAFNKGQVAWAINTTEILPEDIPPEQSYEFTILIQRGEIERRIIVHINPVPYVPKIEIPVPAR